MTAYLAGVTHRRCTEHDRAAEITGPMRSVLAVMSFPVRDARSDCPDSERYLCTLSWASIAKDSGYDRDYIRRDVIAGMVALGLVERVGEVRPRQPAQWLLKIHANAERGRLGVTHPQDEERPWGSDTPTLGVTNPQARGLGTPNPSDSSRPPGSEEGGRSDAAFGASPLPGGRGAAAASSMESVGGRTGLYGEVADALGCSQSQAEAWVERKLAAAVGPVRNEPAFLRRCLAREVEQLAEPRQAARDTAARPPAATTPVRGATSKVRQLPTRDPKRLAAARARRTSRDEQLAAGRRVLDGELTLAQLAAAVDRDVSTVRGWVTAARSAQPPAAPLRSA